MHVLAIDQGTSGTKALVVAADGGVTAAVEVPVRVDSGVDGSVEVDPEVLWNSVVDAGRAALAAAGDHPGEGGGSGTGAGAVEAVGLANQGETVLAWDRVTGEPLSPCIVWQDRRSAELCDRLAAEGWGERLAEITGLELDPYFAAPKIAWLVDRHGLAVDARTVVTTTDTWLLHRLCGSYSTDPATASRTLLMDLDDLSWSAEACSAFGVDPSLLPEIRPNDAVLGTTDAFGRDLGVTGACVDQQAALFGQGCHGRGEAKCTYGTGAFVLTNTGDRPVRSSSGLVASVAWQLGDDPPLWCLDGQVFTVGSAVSWLEAAGVISAPGDLDAVGGTVDEAGGAVFVPGLAGIGAPLWQPRARGAFTGLSLGTTRAHLIRAVIEGIAAQVTFLVRAAEADMGRPLSLLRVDGGLTRSVTLLQAQADLLGIPVEVFPSPHATALGVAAFARRGAGGDPPGTARTPGGRVIEPRWSSDRAGATLDAWLAAATATAALPDPTP